MIYERSLLGITAMEKLIGKKVFGNLLADLIVKSSGKPTLVPDADKRLAISSAAAVPKWNEPGAVMMPRVLRDPSAKWTVWETTLPSKYTLARVSTVMLANEFMVWFGK